MKTEQLHDHPLPYPPPSRGRVGVGGIALSLEFTLSEATVRPSTWLRTNGYRVEGLLAMTLLFVLFSGPLLAQPQHLTILHFNDLHGHIEANCVKKICGGGAARLASAIKRIENENEAKGWKTLLLFGGDAFSGTLISSEFKGEAEIKILNALGVDAMVLGNHDFDYSLPVLEKRMGEAKFTVVVANVIDKKTKEPIAAPTKSIIGVPAPSIVIIGLASKHTPHMTNPPNVSNVVFEDPVKVAKGYLKKSKRLSMRIGLTHLGVEGDVKLAEKTKGFNVIVGGHDHVRPDEYCRTVKKIPVCQAPANGKYLGRLDFEIDGKKVRLAGSGLIPVEKEVNEDPEVAALVQEYSKKIGPKYDIVIGTALTDFPAARGEPSPIGRLVAEAIRNTAKTEIGFINSGGVRTSIKKGPVTPRKAGEVLPFDNYVVKFTLSSDEIKKILDFSISRGGGSFLQISGLTYRIEDKKAVDINIGGDPLDPGKNYTASSVDFITNGGDGYTMLKSKSVDSLNVLVRDALIDYIKEKKKITSAPLNSRS